MEPESIQHAVRGECEVPERVERMIAFLRANAARIARSERIGVSFQCAGRRLVTEIVESVVETGEA